MATHHPPSPSNLVAVNCYPVFVLRRTRFTVTLQICFVSSPNTSHFSARMQDWLGGRACVCVWVWVWVCVWVCVCVRVCVNVSSECGWLGTVDSARKRPWLGSVGARRSPPREPAQPRPFNLLNCCNLYHPPFIRCCVQLIVCSVLLRFHISMNAILACVRALALFLKSWAHKGHQIWSPPPIILQRM